MADLLRILVRSGAKPYVIFATENGPNDLDTGVPVVVATRPDGTTLSPALVASHAGATNSGKYEVTYPPQTELTRTRLDWTGTIGGVTETLTTWVDVVGGHLFTVADARAFKVAGTAVLADVVKYPAGDVIAARDEITDDFTARGGVAFAPRHARETLNGDGTSRLIPAEMLPHRVISVTVNGVAFTAGELADIGFAPGGILVRTAGGTFPSGTMNIDVEYAHGYAPTPPAIRRAALHRLAMLLNPSSAASSAVTSWTSPDGTSYSYDRVGQSRGGMTYHYGIGVIDGPLNFYGMAGMAIA
jgi:hypothetical protein